MARNPYDPTAEDDEMDVAIRRRGATMPLPPLSPPSSSSRADESSSVGGEGVEASYAMPQLGVNTGFAPTSGSRAPRLPSQGGQGSRSFTFQPPSSNAFQYGWDFGRHAGNTYSYDTPAEGAKYAFADYIREAGLDPNSANAASIAQALNGRYGSNVFQPEGDRRVRYGDEFVDWSGEGKPAGQFFWGSASGSGGGADPRPGQRASLGGGASAGLSGLGGGGGSETEIHQAIMRLLQRGEQPVDETSVGAQYLPVRNAYERQGQIARAQLAHRGAAQGTNVGGGGGALEGDIASLNENLASSEGQLMAGLIGEELTNQRQDVAQALQFAQGEQRLQLQRQLAEIDAQLRSRGIDLQRQLGLEGLGLQQQQINNQNRQWYEQFGYSAGLQEYILNQLFNQGLAT